MKHVMNRFRLSTRMFLIMMFVIMIPFTLMIWYVKYDMERILRSEISQRTVQDLTNSESEIKQIFERMASISTVIFYDPDIQKAFSDDHSSYYDRATTFDNVIRGIPMHTIYNYEQDSVDVVFMDNQQRLYSSWSLNYGDYSYLFAQDWVRESLQTNGFIVWNVSSQGYGRTEEDRQNKRQISLARAVFNDTARHQGLGILLVSVDHQSIYHILENYRYSPSDIVFMSLGSGGIIHDEGGPHNQQELMALAESHVDRRRGNSVINLDEKEYLLTFYTVSLGNLRDEVVKIYYLTDYQYLNNQIGLLVAGTNIACVVFVVAALFAAVLIAGFTARPIRALANQMSRYQVGGNPQKLEQGRKDEIGRIYTAYYDMADNINALFLRLKQEQLTKETYYYESLRSKMSPHFLFNTLTSIRWMAVIRQADNIRDSIDDLAAILKYSLDNDRKNVRLGEELDIIENYCRIQNVRFGNGARLSVDVPQPLRRCRIIKFILQPTVENCYKHAFLKTGASEGCISIRGWRQGDTLHISVSDNGKGFSEQAIRVFYGQDPKGEYAPSGGIGLSIINQRIRASYGDAYGIELVRTDGQGAQVEYLLPYLCSEEDEM